MANIGCISERLHQHWPSYFVVYEWEDVFAQNGIKIKCQSRLSAFINKVMNKVFKGKLNNGKVKYFRYNKKQVDFVWVMNAASYKKFAKKGYVPIFLDFAVNMVDEICQATKYLPFYFVTCLDIYNILKSKGSENVYYIPLSISDKYFTESVPEKSVDVIQFGRKNSILHEYMMRYCNDHPQVEYVYQSGDGSLTYESTTRGNIGRFDKRKDYFDLMASCRVSLVSSPGKDSSRDFGGIDFITPRFYESAINYCYMLGRYTENEESKLIGIDKVCPHIESYDEFEKNMDMYLKDKDFSKTYEYKEFIKNNVTSKRLEEIVRVVNNRAE